MKLNKNIILFTLPLEFIFFVVSYIINLSNLSAFWCNITLGIFCSLLVTTLISLVNYLHYKDKLLHKIHSHLIQMYHDTAILNNILKIAIKKFVRGECCDITLCCKIANEIENEKPNQYIYCYSEVLKSSKKIFFFSELLVFLQSFQLSILLNESKILIYKKMISNKKLTNQDLGDIIKNLAEIQCNTNKIITKLDSTITKFEQYHTVSYSWQDKKELILRQLPYAEHEFEIINIEPEICK